MHRRSLISLVVGGLAQLPLARLALGQTRQLTPEEAALIDAISAHNSAIRTMVGRFLQIERQGGRIEGTFYIERPNKVRFRYDPPSRQEIMSLGKGFYVIDRREKTQSVYPQSKVPLRQFLDERIDLRHAGLTDFHETAHYVEVTLEDETPQGKVRIALVFDKLGLDLVQWVLATPDGGVLTFSLYDLQKNIEIPNTYFLLNINDYNKASEL